MTVYQMLETAATLSNDEKFEVVEALVQMLRQELNADSGHSVSEIAAPYIADERVQTSLTAEIDFDEASDSNLDALLYAHLHSPDPEPHQMLPYGLFKGANFTEEDFRAAEWHPSAEDIASA